KGASIVTYHKSWSYFAKRYGINVVGFVEPKPGLPPTPAHTLDLIKLMQDQKVKYILMENFYDAKVPQLIAGKTGAKLAVVPNSVEGEDAVKTYFDLFDRIVGELEKGLKT
ncbi:MAG TPA: metal ABC transporter substrate-binding protein, partial [bacterium]|nr:metal ABC transporter substrate-binding protein [bacterium]